MTNKVMMILDHKKSLILTIHSPNISTRFISYVNTLKHTKSFIAQVFYLVIGLN